MKLDSSAGIMWVTPEEACCRAAWKADVAVAALVVAAQPLEEEEEEEEEVPAAGPGGSCSAPLG